MTLHPGQSKMSRSNEAPGWAEHRDYMLPLLNCDRMIDVYQAGYSPKEPVSLFLLRKAVDWMRSSETGRKWYKEKFALGHRYGPDPKTYKAMGDLVGLTKNRMRQLAEKGLRIVVRVSYNPEWMERK